MLNFIPDVMHVMHLGVYQYFFGSVLKFITHHVMGGSPRDNAASLFGELKIQYRECGIEAKCNDMKVSMYWDGKPTEFPCLKGKAAEVRNPSKPLLVVAQNHLPDDVPVHKIIKKNLENAKIGKFKFEKCKREIKQT